MLLIRLNHTIVGSVLTVRIILNVTLHSRLRLVSFIHSWWQAPPVWLLLRNNLSRGCSNKIKPHCLSLLAQTFDDLFLIALLVVIDPSFVTIEKEKQEKKAEL